MCKSSVLWVSVELSILFYGGYSMDLTCDYNENSTDSYYEYLKEVEEEKQRQERLDWHRNYYEKPIMELEDLLENDKFEQGEYIYNELMALPDDLTPKEIEFVTYFRKLLDKYYNPIIGQTFPITVNITAQEKQLNKKITYENLISIYPFITQVNNAAKRITNWSGSSVNGYVIDRNHNCDLYFNGKMIAKAICVHLPNWEERLMCDGCSFTGYDMDVLRKNGFEFWTECCEEEYGYY